METTCIKFPGPHGGLFPKVGGDVWSAALLLSAWLLTNPEVIRDQAILELGSGLGLCGIVAGYLSESVILTGLSSL